METWVVASRHVPTGPPWCGCHDNGHGLATAHCTFSSYGRLEAEPVNQFWLNLAHNSKLGPRWQSHEQILKFLKFKMADGRHVGKYWKYHNSPSNGPIRTKFGWLVASHHVPVMFTMMRLPWQWPAIAWHWTFSSYGHLERVNQFWWNLVYNSKLGPQWQSHDQILQFLKFKMADCRHVGKYSKCHHSPANGPTGTQLGWWHPIMFPILEMP